MGRTNQGKKITKGSSLGRLLVNDQHRKRNLHKLVAHKMGTHVVEIQEEKLASVVERNTLDDFLADAVPVVCARVTEN